MRSYLVVMDETEEAQAALRFAARRAARTGGGVEILALIPQQEFVQWSGVQAAMEEEARLRAEAMIVQASSAIAEEAGIKPSITVRQGDPVKAVTELLKERDDLDSEPAARSPPRREAQRGQRLLGLVHHHQIGSHAPSPRGRTVRQKPLTCNPPLFLSSR